MTEPESESGDDGSVARCTICHHEARKEIESACRALRPERQIAEQFSVSKAAINRHKRHMAVSITDSAARRKELERRLGKAKDDRDYAVLSRELRALEEHEIRLKQESSLDKPLKEQPGFQLFLTHLLNTIGECERCRELVLNASHPGDTRSE